METNKKLYSDMGNRLKKLRINNNYTQENMAELLGMSLTYYSRVERGKNGLSLEKLLIIYQIFNIDLTYLITGEKNGKSVVEQLYEKCPDEKKEYLEFFIRDAVKLAQ